MISVDKLSVRSKAAGSYIFRDICLGVEAGETVALIGASGSGKSTLAGALLDMLPDSFEMSAAGIFLNNEKVYGKGINRLAVLRGKRISMAPQNGLAALNPVFTVGTQLRDIIRTHSIRNGRAARLEALESLVSVGFDSPEQIYQSYSHRLSGGMAQRCVLAMALSCRPAVLIADEPTSSLDSISGAAIREMIKLRQKAIGFALLWITHDPVVARTYADRVLQLEAGFITECDSNPRERQPQDGYIYC